MESMDGPDTVHVQSVHACPWTGQSMPISEEIGAKGTRGWWKGTRHGWDVVTHTFDQLQSTRCYPLLTV